MPVRQDYCTAFSSRGVLLSTVVAAFFRVIEKFLTWNQTKTRPTMHQYQPSLSHLPLLPLPSHLLTKVFEYDLTYRRVYNVCLLELALLWHHHETLHNIINRFKRETLLFQIYSEGTVNVILNSNV